MHLARRAWCRTYQTVFRIALPILPYTEPRILEHAEDVPAVLQKRSIQKVLIVTDPGIARLGLTAPLETALASRGIGVTVYAETRANPTVSNVEEAASLYRESACQAIIGFGGGSAMDCAKGVGARIAQPNKPINKMRGLLRIHRRLPLLIAVPTTAGTGSEVTLAAVITDDGTHYKYPINDFVLIPRFAVHDPEFTRGLPASITGQTGMDALTHAVEAFIGRSTTPYTRKMARQAVQLIHDNLLEAYEHGDDMRARRNMLSAAYKAGVAPATARDSLAAEAFIDWVDRMNEALGIPKYVSGIRRSDIPEMAAHADAEANPLYPVPLLMDRLELERMYEVVAGGMFEDEN